MLPVPLPFIQIQEEKLKTYSACRTCSLAIVEIADVEIFSVVVVISSLYLLTGRMFFPPYSLPSWLSDPPRRQH